MAFRVEISPQAFEDLDSISAYIRHRGSFESAERWFNGIMAAIKTLCDAPQRCPLAGESHGTLAPGYIGFYLIEVQLPAAWHARPNSTRTTTTIQPASASPLCG
jgi:plasmid stabilization system protein ParE